MNGLSHTTPFILPVNLMIKGLPALPAELPLASVNIVDEKAITVEPVAGSGVGAREPPVLSLK